MEFNLSVTAYADKMKTDRDNSLVLTYLGAYWQRVKEMPSLDEVLGREPKKKEVAAQTPEQMLEKIKALNAAFGGNVT